MSEHSKPKAWIWRDPESKYCSNIVNYVTNDTKTKELVILRSISSPVTEGSLFTEYILELCHAHGLLENERTTYLSFKDHLLALELCISNINKKTVDKQDLSQNSLVLGCHEKYVAECLEARFEQDSDQHAYIDSYKTFLKHTNCTNIWHMYSLLKDALESSNSKLKEYLSSRAYLMLGHFDSEIFISFIKLLLEEKEVIDLVFERPLNSSLDGSLSPKSSTNITAALTPLDDSMLISGPNDNHSSATEEFAEDVILSFLNLLVNSRNELSLSRAMTSPLIELSHVAFTDLKHVSMQKEMPMCQTVISYVTRFRLGGKSYAPPLNCPLQCHLKGLGQFVDILNQLQTILEEESSLEVAVKKTINVLKKKLLKCKNSSLRESSIEAAAGCLIKTSLERIKRLKCVPEGKIRQIGQQSFDTVLSLVNYRKCYQDCWPSKPAGVQSSHRTPLNLPPLMGYFRTPDEIPCSEEESQSSLHSNVAVIINEATADSVSSLSYFHSANSNSVQGSCVSEKTPSKVSFKNCLGETESTTSIFKSTLAMKEIKPLASKNQRNKAIAKRLILDDISNQKRPKKASTAKPAAKVKTKPQIKGQGKISAFFVKK